MPVPAQDAALAASPGFDVKRERARRTVALEFFKLHIFEADTKKDWSVVQKALQCIDYQRPVTFGPMPPAPARLQSLPRGGPLGAGFFREIPPSPPPAAADRRGAPEAFTVSPEAVYMKFFAPTVGVDAVSDPIVCARYFLPGARSQKGRVVVTRERG